MVMYISIFVMAAAIKVKKKKNNTSQMAWHHLIQVVVQETLVQYNNTLAF